MYAAHLLYMYLTGPAVKEAGRRHLLCDRETWPSARMGVTVESRLPFAPRMTTVRNAKWS